MKLEELVSYLDGYLAVGETGDDRNALNGLQVSNSGKVSSIAAAVDACQATVDAAAACGADLLIVHHGLFWRGLEPLVGRAYRRVRALVQNDIALYSSHAPLDRHAEVGNNAVLASRIGLTVRGSFGDYCGARVGVWGETDLGRDELRSAVEAVLGAPARLLACGPARSRRVGIVTGAAGSSLREAHAAGLDTFITGEGQHWTYFDAEELEVNMLLAGHYATETLGVRALAEHVSKRFGIPWTFLDHPTGM
jgi:dinuclear metal center YbgI/SA1388 family protein